jgi:UDP-N-acetyl-D-mannosaminuronic acid dehydrogenase
VKAVVVALGKVGLPLAAQIARHHEVVGCDIDPAVVEAVGAGRSPFPGEPGLDEALAEAVGAGRLRASTDTSAAVAEGPDLVVAVPPLLIDEDSHAPDYSALNAVAEAIGGGLKAGATVSLETTVPVGTTRERLGPMLEAASGLRAEEDFGLVFSPERVSSGSALHDLAAYPKLVGGVGPRSEADGIARYGAALDAPIWGMGSAEAAEMTKLAETVYRNVNIALANEYARFADAHGIDLDRVIEAANSQPYSHVHRPGIAVGGHCIPVYPHLYLDRDPDAHLPRTADEVNRAMPAYAVDALERALGGLSGTTVAILGVAFRGGVKETAFSGAFPVRDELERRGARVLASDPLYDDDELRALGFEPWAPATPVDAAVIQADHADYARLTPELLPGARVVLDGRGRLDASALEAGGVTVVRLGRPDA